MKLIFDFAAQQIILDGDAPNLMKIVQEARKLVPAISQISINTAQAGAHRQTPKPASSAASASANGHSLSGQTVRQFIKSLRLAGASESIAAIAYYYKHREGVETFSPKDMSTWFTHANLQKPSQMPVAVFYAKKKYGYVQSAVHGKWRLTTNGENLIVGKLNQSDDSEGS